ncbi:MutS family DNA mismatch repair protein [Gangjinia marincola]|uniref:MutS family DNA mismatch repair protein n=1 Tax=Gangjinia marincola TaxID=578463 RepID=A0ABN1MH44_9FLAO
MPSSNQFHREQITTHLKRSRLLKKKLVISSTLRGILFIALLTAMYFAYPNAKLVIGLLVMGVVLFLILVTRHDNIKSKRRLHQKIITLSEMELRGLKGDFSTFSGGKEYKNAHHYFSHDIDLFGDHSFFQQVNRTGLPKGGKVLANLITSNAVENIKEKQNVVKELAAIPEWRQLFTAHAQLVQPEESPERILKWLREYTFFTPKFTKALVYGFSAVSVALLIGYWADVLPGKYPLIWFFIGFGISGRYFAKVNAISSRTSKAQSTFRQYYQLIALVEQQEFKSNPLKDQREKIISTSKKASAILKSFAKRLDELDQRNNFLIGIFGNAFLLRDLYKAHQIEHWIKMHRDKVAQWFDVIPFFDAYNSLANYAFNHQNYTYPIIVNDHTVIKAVQLVHPMIDPAVAVRSNFHINTGEFFITTGANMAGKSTFLRTVGLHIVMANVGLPVCAEKSHYHPIKLITSMRTTDSLTDDASYFFSELKRLQFITEEIQKDRYFIILDEILKGTNSTDKAEGSAKFVEKLVQSKSTGIIATHDLSLCKTAEKFDRVKNYYFDAVIKNDELYFDYTLKEGVCSNMNASFLMKKMGIVDH